MSFNCDFLILHLIDFLYTSELCSKWFRL